MARDDDFADLLDELGAELEPNAVAQEVAPVAWRLANEAPPRELKRAAAGAAEAIWDEDLRADLSEALRGLREEEIGRIEAIDAALQEVEKPAGANRIALALVYRAAAELMMRANRNYERLEALEAELQEAPPEEHRPLALPIAAAAIPAVGIDSEEAAEAAARFVESFPEDWEQLPAAADQAAHWLGRRLATDERRQTMRAGLAELVKGAQDDFPRAAAALTSLLEEPMPEDPAEDDLWINLVVALVQEELSSVAFEDDALLP